MTPGRWRFVFCPGWECDGSGVVPVKDDDDLPCGSCEAGAAWMAAVIAVFGDEDAEATPRTAAEWFWRDTPEATP